MPVILRNPIECISQKEFSDIAYAVMPTVFEVHRDLGRLFDEKIYEEAAAYFCSPNSPIFRLDIRNDHGQVIGSQDVQLLAPDVAVQFSAFSPDYLEQYELHLTRFLKHTSLRAIQWINLARSQVRLKTIRR